MDDAAKLLEKICTYLRTGYEPADSMREADTLYTTEELRRNIELHILEPIDGQIIYDALIKCGYSYTIINLKAKWCLRKV